MEEFSMIQLLFSGMNLHDEVEMHDLTEDIGSDDHDVYKTFYEALPEHLKEICKHIFSNADLLNCVNCENGMTVGFKAGLLVGIEIGRFMSKYE